MGREMLTTGMREALEELADVYARGETETGDVDGRSAEALVRAGLASNRRRRERVPAQRGPARYAITTAGLEALGRDPWTEIRCHTALSELRRRRPHVAKDRASRVVDAVRVTDPRAPDELWRTLTRPDGPCRLEEQVADAVVRAAASVKPEDELTGA